MNAHSVVGVSHGGQGWHFACAHQSVELAAVVDPRLWQQVERGSKEGLRWLASVNVKTCGEKTSVVKSAGVLQWLCCLLVSSAAKAAGVLLTADHWELCSFPLFGWYW